jgi:transcription factor IIIB subunit 2
MILGFIESLARSLNASGLSPRTVTLFHQAREAMRVRWGRRAKQVAGTCLAIALRESNRPDCLHDIADLLDEPFIAMSRTLVSVTTALGLSLGRVDSGSHIPVLQQHLSSLLQDTSSSVHPGLRQELSAISLHAAAKTAISLSNLLTRIGSPSVTQHPTPPVACAIFILALESELRSAIKQLGPLAEILSTRSYVGKNIVMTLYKIVQDAVANLTENIPWLDKHHPKNGRAAVAKRNVVARAAKDIIAFYDDTSERTKQPVFNVAYDDGLPESDDNHKDETILPRKKLKTGHQTQKAMQFLLNPITGPTPHLSLSRPLEPHTSPRSAAPQHNYNFMSYFLSARVANIKPTRLQILIASRGSAEDVTDEELFDEGELEALMRSEEEMKVIAHLQDWGDAEEDVDIRAKPRKRKGISSESERQAGSRIDLDALAKLLNDDDDSNNPPFIGLLGTEYDGDSADEAGGIDDETRSNLASSDEIVIQRWRPPSPGNNLANDWYDQVYD